MKKTWIVLVMALAGFGVVSMARSQEPAPPATEKPSRSTGETPHTDSLDPATKPPKMIQVQVEFIELSHESLTKLLFLSNPAVLDATPLRKQLQEMIAKKEANVLETQILLARNGVVANSEAIHEWIYPTEYQPVTQEEREKKRNAAVKAVVASGMMVNPATPTAFDTRNVGSTLEIEPTLDADNKTIDLRLQPELLWHSGNTVWHEGKDSAGNPFKVQMPDFYLVRINTSITCISGQYSLIGTVSPKNAKGEVDQTRKVMVFVKCNVLSVR